MKLLTKPLVCRIDPIAQVIPIVIDYILDKDMAEERSLSEVLNIDERFVRMALLRLKDHGLLQSEEILNEFFKIQFGDKLGLKNFDFGPVQLEAPIKKNEAKNKNVTLPQNQNELGARAKSIIYFFNMDILYVLKAKIFQLENQFIALQESQDNQGNYYVCPLASEGKCMAKGQDVLVDEISYETGQQTCSLCKSNLVINKKSSLSE